MGVPPESHLRVFAHVLVAHVETAHPGCFPVHHNDLAVVAEVQLEAADLPVQGVELTENEERYHMKYVLKYTDEMIDNIIAIADNDQPGVIID